MSVDVLGFRRKDASYERWHKDLKGYVIDKKFLVPVRLVSESVSLKWLESYCWENNRTVFGKLPFTEEDMVSVKDLLKAASKQAVDKKDE